jgi:hypothetical protein
MPSGAGTGVETLTVPPKEGGAKDKDKDKKPGVGGGTKTPTTQNVPSGPDMNPAVRVESYGKNPF